MAQEKNNTTLLWVLGSASTAIYAFILKISFSFDPSGNTQERPILLMLGLFAAAFVIYFIACFFFRGTKGSNGTDHRGRELDSRGNANAVAVIFFFGIIFRLMLLFSSPIQEVDIYRYIWDGLSTNQGVDPYQYPPNAVTWDVDFLKHSSNSLTSWPGITPPTLNQDMEKLVRLAATHDGIEKILRQVHFAQFTTVYPPVSQWVFAAATRLVPVDSNASLFIFATKAAIILFDLGTAILIVVLLRKLGLPTTWSIAYCWCPLLLKEFANSGHLDSIAVFLCTAGIVATVDGLTRKRQTAGEVPSGGDCESMKPRRVRTQNITTLAHASGYHPSTAISNSKVLRPRGEVRSLIWFSIAGVALALAVGAKLYPVIIVPLWACACIKLSGWRGVLAVSVFTLVAAAVCWPMVRHTTIVQKSYPSVVPKWLQSSLSLPPKKEIKTRQPYPAAQYPSGIESFFDSWEMNDFLFMIVVENLKVAQPMLPGDKAPPNPWFSVVDQNTRIRLGETVTDWTGKDGSAFSMARQMTLAAFAIIVLWSCVSIVRDCEPENFCRLSFLTIAWFWLLSPTQNPWYWSWALPLVVFARSRIWLGVAAVVMLYYLRFYFEYHFAGQPVLGTPYEGVHFFDFVIPWIEFGPILLMLFAAWVFHRKSQP